MDVLAPLHVFVQDTGTGTAYQVARAIRARTHRNLFFNFVTMERGRYLIPFIMNSGGIALFVDEAYSHPGDVARFFKQRRQHDICPVYVPPGEAERPFPSIMLFWNKYCEALTPNYVYSATVDQLAPVVWAGGPQNVGPLEV